MFHVYGMTSCLTTTLFSGGSIFLLTRFRTAEVLETIARLRPTVIPVVPAMVEAICGLLEQNPQPEACRVIREAMIVSGAAALEPATAERFLRLTGGHIVQGYGLTEASPVTHINPPGAPQPGSIGLPLPDTRCRVVSLNDPTVDVAPGEAGELLISGPQVCCGYYRNGPETRLLLDMDAHHVTWLHTADVVRVDEKGYYHVVDRKKHMINRSGMKVCRPRSRASCGCIPWWPTWQSWDGPSRRTASRWWPSSNRARPHPTRGGSMKRCRPCAASTWPPTRCRAPSR